MSVLKVTDLQNFRIREIKNRPFVCIVAEEVPQDVADEARLRDVHLINYKRIPDLVPLLRGQPAMLQTELRPNEPGPPEDRPSEPAQVPAATVAQSRSIHLHTGRLREPFPKFADDPCTFFVALRLDEQPTHLRIGFANTIDLAYQIDGVSACLAAAYGDGVNPPDPTPWTSLTPQEGAGNQGLTVAGNGGGLPIPAITFSEWADIPPQPEADGPLSPVLFLRVTCAAHSSPRSCVTDDGLSQTLAAHDRPYRLHQRLGPDPSATTGEQVTGYEKATSTPIYCIQYRSARPGATLLVSGDSHFSGYGTPGAIDSFGLISSLQLSTPDFTLTCANYAWAGSSSRLFLPTLERMLEICRPDIVLLQGWTANDGPSEEAAIAYADRIEALARRASSIGTQPILVTRFARKTFAERPEELATAERLRHRQLALASSELLVLDAPALLEHPDSPGLFRPGLSDDGIHPNLAGHILLATALTPLLRQVLPNDHGSPLCTAR